MIEDPNAPVIDPWNLRGDLAFDGRDDLPLVDITIARARLLLGGADISTDQRGLTRVVCKHPTGTDNERDGAILASLEFVDFKPIYTIEKGMVFEARLIEGRFYRGGLTPEKVADASGEPPVMCTYPGCASQGQHRTDLPFQPAPMVILPILTTLSVSFDEAERQRRRKALAEASA